MQIENLAGDVLSDILEECCKEMRRVEGHTVVYWCGLQYAEDTINLQHLEHECLIWLANHNFSVSQGNHTISVSYMSPPFTDASVFLQETYPYELGRVIKATNWAKRLLEDRDVS